ncbi:MAG: DinB family protein, partial [Planctomycetota bacterium]
MTTATTSTLFDTGKAALDLSRRCTLKMIEDIPPDKLCHQPLPGTKHALWVLGHLLCTDDYFASSLGGRESVVGEEWQKLF